VLRLHHPYGRLVPTARETADSAEVELGADTRLAGRADRGV